MEFVEFVSSWRKCTSNFSSESFWKMRLGMLGIFSKKDLYKYWEKLSHHNNKDIWSLLLTDVKTNLADGKHSFVEHQIAQELSIFTTNAIHYSKMSFVFSEQAKNILNNEILSQLWNITSKTILFEHRVFTKAFPMENPSFAYFVDKITCNPKWLKNLMLTYPILCEDLNRFRTNYKLFMLEFCYRLGTDYEEICQVFDISQVSQNILCLNPFCGDMHRGGRSTVSIKLSDKFGHKHTIFYKPKPLSSDLIWNAIIEKMWKIGIKRTVLLTTNIDKGSYGWQKGEKPCKNVKNEEELKSYCFNQGVNIILAYMFGIQDLIADNILIIRDIPVFFDMEMLLLPISPNTGDYLTDSCVAQHYLQGVIKTGLVPCYGFETLNHEGFDNSGLSLNKGKRNTPDLHGEQFYAEDLLEGFNYACNFIKTHKKEIISILEEIKRSRHLQTRFLVRYTFNYAQLLKALYSPLCQGDAIQRHLTVEYLWRGYNKTVLNEAIIEEEIRQITQGDIPIFTTSPLTLDLCNERGEVVVKDYFQRDGITASIHKVSCFSEKEALMQKDILLRALYIHGFIDSPDNLSIFLKASKPSNLDLISQIANILYSLPQGFEDTKYFTYIDYVISKDNIWDQGLQHIDIFQGVIGVGVFFMAWYKFSHESKARVIIKKIYKESIEYLRNNQNILLDSPIVKLGVMHFPTSILYYYIMGQKIMKEEGPGLSESDLDFILYYDEKRYTKDENFDYFSGSTGLILVLIELNRIHSSKRIRQVILILGDYLLHSSICIKTNMISWKKKAFGFWGGFAHGNSAISYALFKLWEFGGDYKFYQAGLKALKYDQALFDTSKKYWNKTLSESGEIHHSWGNGSAGIALSRYLIMPYFKNSLMDEEICAAQHIIRTEINNKTYTDHSVASGLMGLLEIGKLLDKRFPTEEYLASELSSLDLSEIRCGGWVGNPPIVGLYYGYAGIGYNLLKLKFIPELPSLLWI